MQNRRILSENKITSAHLPTVMLVIGYPIYWLEVYWFQAGQGRTTPLAWFLFLTVSVAVLWVNRTATGLLVKDWKIKFSEMKRPARIFVGVGSLLSAGILLCALYASLLPPHLIQEFDALNYHLTLPRQHLILGSFTHIPWAADDLLLLPVDFAIAPYWLATPLPNKFPQFLFLLGLAAVSVNLVKHLKRVHPPANWIMLFAVLGLHSAGIQMGTAMLDLVICYLFIAALDSFFAGAFALAVIEFSFFFWAKSFIPVQMTLIVAGMLVMFFVLRKFGFFVVGWGLNDPPDFTPDRERPVVCRKMIAGFVILSLLIGGPFVAKSIYYSGTPFFPLVPGLLNIGSDIEKNPKAWQSLIGSSEKWTKDVRDNYGHGRSLTAFLKHFWLLAVPEKGVNNAFDYPLGLMYLIFLGPFVYVFYRSLRGRQYGIIPFFVVFYWGSWWFGSQQSRFLYIPLILSFAVVLAEMRRYSKTFFFAVTLALLMTTISVVRAHRHDFGVPFEEILRKKDLELIRMNANYIKKGDDGYVDLDFHDVAYAGFPVNVIRENLPHTLAY
jgi:hypothetical protein